MLQDAKKNGNPTVTTWLDLQNACGTVPHNLIQFALEWYHITEHIRKIIFNYFNQLFICVKTIFLMCSVIWYHSRVNCITEHIRKIVFNYYNQLFICVKTKEWTTNWIQCCIGVFQVWPIINYRAAVFNLCLDLSSGTRIFYSFIFLWGGGGHRGDKMQF